MTEFGRDTNTDPILVGTGLLYWPALAQELILCRTFGGLHGILGGFHSTLSCLLHSVSDLHCCLTALLTLSSSLYLLSHRHSPCKIFTCLIQAWTVLHEGPRQPLAPISLSSKVEGLAGIGGYQPPERKK